MAKTIPASKDSTPLNKVLITIRARIFKVTYTKPVNIIGQFLIMLLLACLIECFCTNTISSISFNQFTPFNVFGYVVSTASVEDPILILK